MILGNFYNKNILFLQGPMGNFFSNISVKFDQLGSKSFFIALNGGDLAFSRLNVSLYTDSFTNWSDYIKEYLIKNNIDKIFLFGDCRKYHIAAISIAKELNISVFVFEEGYIRPNFITLEEYGVNANSDNIFSKNIDYTIKKRLSIPTSFYKKALSAMTYYLFCFIFSFIFNKYEHHKDLSIINEIKSGFKSFLNKYFRKESFPKFNNYFFIPLQVHNDSQITHHSSFSSIEDFIDSVLLSYSLQKVKKPLVFKHHPMDRGKKDYSNYIYNKAKSLHIKDSSIFVCFDLDIKLLLEKAIGTITINSTVGMSSLYHGVPVITLGNAFYDQSYLTQKNLDLFWFKQVLPKRSLVENFRKFIISKTQINSSFYGYLNFNAFKEKILI